MPIQILNNGASLKIVQDGNSRLILKSQVKAISASGSNLKIETCGCGESCLFLPFAQVSDPEMDSLINLRDEINAMLNNSLSIENATLDIDGVSTEQKQVESIVKLQEIKDAVVSASNSITSTLEGNFDGKASESLQIEIKAAAEAGNALLTVLSAALPGLFTTLKTGASTEAKQNEILLKLDTITAQLLDGLEDISSPAGAATDASVLLVKVAVETIGTLLGDKSTSALQTAGNNKLQDIQSALFDLTDMTDGSAANIIAGLVSNLAGKSTEAKQDTQLTSLSNIITALDNLNTAIATLQTNVTNSVNTGLTGKSTEAQQIDTLAKLNEIKIAVEDVASFIMGKLDEVTDNMRVDFQIANKFEIPLRVDNQLGTIYKGFADPGTLDATPAWAILRITTAGDVQTSEWAGGNRNFTNSWTGRAVLIYS